MIEFTQSTYEEPKYSTILELVCPQILITQAGTFEVPTKETGVQSIKIDFNLIF